MSTHKIAPTRVSSHLARDGSWQPCIQNPCNPPQVCFARVPLIKMRCPSLLAPFDLLLALAIPSLDALAAKAAGLPGLPGVPGLALLGLPATCEGSHLHRCGQICFHMAPFGHLSVQIWIKPFSNPDTRSQSHCRFASRWLHLDAFLSRSGSDHFQVPRRSPKTIADLVPDGFIRTPCCPDLDQAILIHAFAHLRLNNHIFHRNLCRT